MPIFNALLAYGFFRDQRVTGGRLVGVVVGFVGVAVLVGAQPQAKVLGALAVVGMAICYGAGGLLARRYLSEVRPPVVAFGTTAIAALVMMPAGVRWHRDHIPGWKTFASILVLGVVATAAAYLLFFTLVAGAGAAYASLVTYLVPPIALAYGAIFLGERFGASAFAGLALILAGVGLGTRTRRRTFPVAEPARGGLSGHASSRNRRGRRLAGRALHGRRRRAVPRRPAVARPETPWSPRSSARSASPAVRPVDRRAGR